MRPHLAKLAVVEPQISQRFGRIAGRIVCIGVQSEAHQPHIAGPVVLQDEVVVVGEAIAQWLIVRGVHTVVIPPNERLCVLAQKERSGGDAVQDVQHAPSRSD